MTSTSTHLTRRLRTLGPATLVRLGGIVAILAAIALAPTPPTSTSGGVPSVETLDRYRLTPASIDQMPRLEEVASEPEARGCSASVIRDEIAHGGVVLSMRCGMRGVLTISVRHLPLEAKPFQRTNDCLVGAAFSELSCRASGTVAEPLRGQLVAAVDRVFVRVFPRDPYGPARGWNAPACFAAGAIAIPAIFLWLVVSGTFTFGSWGKGDWIAIVPFAGALVVRELLTLHSVQEIEIQFALTMVGRHSLVYPLFQLFYAPLVRDAQAATFHVNGVLGALAVLPLYLFVRQRTADRAAAVVVCCLFAVNPLVARFAPTDAPYSFIFFTWFSGLALLSAPAADVLSTFGGAVLLGIAASARMDGIFYLAASALMLGPKLLVTRIRNAPRAAFAGACAIALLIGVQMYFLFAEHAQGMVLDRPPWTRMHEMWVLAILRPTEGDTVWAALVAVGLFAGIVRRWRLALGAFAGVVVLLLTAPSAICPFWIIPPGEESPNAWHRFVPAAALQCIVAGIGAIALAPPPSGARRKKDWAAALPGIVAALYVLLAHRAALSESYVFNDEYAMVRRHLVHDGIAEIGCDLFFLNRYERDVDLRDFRRVVPEITTIDCRAGDCARGLTADHCQYYVRSAACFFHPDGVPRGCGEARSDADILRECLVPECAALESAAELTPIEEHSSNAWITFPGEAWNYPERIPIGLFRASIRAPNEARPPADSEPERAAAEHQPKPASSAAPTDGETLVLPPSATALIERAFARLQPSWRYDSIDIDGNHASVYVCPAPGAPASCFHVRLDPPNAGCANIFGPFCVTFPDRPSPAATEAAIEVALQRIDNTLIWSRLSQRRETD